jgi:hypothetical protein
VRETGELDSGRALAVLQRQIGETDRDRAEILRRLQQLAPGAAHASTLLHGFASVPDGVVVAEYGDRAARVFHLSEKTCRVSNFYAADPRVRHLHSLLTAGDELYVSTGDSARYLDLWRLSADGPVFVRRARRALCGFTTCANLDGDSYFGSDYSGRPNFLYAYKANRRYFFPMPAYLQICRYMTAFRERYLICLNGDLHAFGGQQSMSVFDTKAKQFVIAEPLSEPVIEF